MKKHIEKHIKKHMKKISGSRIVAAVLMVLMVLSSVVCMSCCSSKVKTYNVDYCGGKSFYTDAEDAYRPGEEVTLYYHIVATDTDYSFYLDGELLNVTYDAYNGYVIRFTMPEHDVKLECEMKNTMEYIPETEPESENMPEDTSETESESNNAAEYEPETKSKIKNKKTDVSDTEPEISVYWAYDVLSQYPDYEEFIADESGQQESVVFTTNVDVSNFKVTALTLEDVSEDGKITFSVEDLYVLDTLTPERPLVAAIPFFGAIPTYGISYEDNDGTVRNFTVEVSGKDGSLILQEF